MIALDACLLKDRNDPIAALRERFVLPDGVIYLDGNSLGALPKTTPLRIEHLVREQWGHDLIESWNRHEWATLPQRVGDKLGRLLGAQRGEVICADSTSINIFKLLAAALALPEARGRKLVLSERGNFPTDLYMIQGLSALLPERFEMKLIEDDDIASHITRDVAVMLFTHVDYRSGRMLDMAALNASAKAAGTRIIWDLSHSAGALPVALNADGCELAVGCGYKYLNGGPGAPAYLYVAKHLQAQVQQPLSGWFGHAAPFEFDAQYRPAPGIERLMVGTPSIIATAALECGVDVLLETDLLALREKSLALGDLFLDLVEQECGQFNFQLATPRAPHKRGSQLAFHHPHAYPIMQALIERGVIGDFRKPDFLRFGIAPLYLRYVDMWNAVAILKDIMQCAIWREVRFQQRRAVT